MGTFAEAMVEYARPLLDETDGSHEEVQKALGLAQMCWNIGVLPEEKRETVLADLQANSQMDDDEFEDFRTNFLRPMLQRYDEMFGDMPQFVSARSATRSTPSKTERTGLTRGGTYPGTPRNAPCPCHSGKKYKQCCGP